MREEYVGWLDDEWNVVLDHDQPITRCRDCKYCMSYWKSDYCDYFSHVTNDLDGFCSWASPREEDE